MRHLRRLTLAAIAFVFVARVAGRSYDLGHTDAMKELAEPPAEYGLPFLRRGSHG